jgi:hypothetical protein
MRRFFNDTGFSHIPTELSELNLFAFDRLASTLADMNESNVGQLSPQARRWLNHFPADYKAQPAYSRLSDVLDQAAELSAKENKDLIKTNSLYLTNLVKHANALLVVPPIVGGGIGHLAGEFVHRRRKKEKDTPYASWWSDPRNKYRAIGTLLGALGSAGGAAYVINAGDKRLQAEIRQNKKDSDEYWRQENIRAAINNEKQDADAGYRTIRMMEALRRSTGVDYNPDGLKKYLDAARRVEVAKIRAEQINALGLTDGNAISDDVIGARMKSWDENPVVHIPEWLDRQIIQNANITDPPLQLKLRGAP